MNEEILISRREVTRRRALAIGGSVSLGGLLAACGGDDSSSDAAATDSTTSTTSTTATSTEGATDVAALLDAAPSCVMTPEQTQGPYWFDVDSIRDDLREGRPGAKLELALRVQDLSTCDSDGKPAAVPNAVVEIWHCDAGGVYSGFESASAGGGPGFGAGGETSDGSYSQGDQEAVPGDDATFLRGAQPTGSDGVARFTTIYPGWYPGRTVHIHLKVHMDKKTVLTSQIYFDEKLSSAVFETSPYDERTGRETFNEDDSIYDETGLVAVAQSGEGYIGAINLGIDA